jgi:hypothetical protein
MTLLAANAAAPILRILVILIQLSQSHCKAKQIKAKQKRYDLGVSTWLQQRGLCSNKSNNLNQKQETDKGRKEKEERNERVDEERDAKRNEETRKGEENGDSIIAPPGE